MKKLILSCLATLVGFVAQSQADTVYTDMPTFFAALKGQSYTETFSSGTASSTAPVLFSLNGFSFTVTGAGGTYYDDGVIGAVDVNASVTISFTSGNVLAVGGNFFETDVADNFLSAAVTLTLNDGTTATYTPTSESTYRGFTSTTPITSLTFAAPTDTNYATLDNLTVGTTVPEPSTWAMLGFGAAGAGVVALRSGERLWCLRATCPDHLMKRPSSLAA